MKSNTSSFDSKSTSSQGKYLEEKTIEKSKAMENLKAVENHKTMENSRPKCFQAETKPLHVDHAIKVTCMQSLFKQNFNDSTSNVK
jgi:hypothetical protein